MTMPPFPQEGYPRPGHPEDPPWTPWAQAVHAAAAAVTTGRLSDAELREAFDARYARDMGWIVGTDPAYGAVADWTGGTTGTDNTAAIQAGLDAAAAGRTGYFLPAGQYKITGQLNLPQYTDMRGAGYTALSQDVYGGAQWKAPTPGVTYGGTVIHCTATTGAAIFGDHAIGARWTLRDFLVVGPGSGTSVGVRLADTGSFNIRPNLVNVGAVNFSKGWKVGTTNEGTYDSLVSYACATGFEFGPFFNANQLSNIEVQRSTVEAIILDGVSNHFSGGIIQSCSGTSGLRVTKPANTFDAIYLENITATNSVRFDAGGTFNGYLAGNAGNVQVNGSGVLLECLYAPSAVVTIADAAVGTVLNRCSVASVNSPVAEYIDIGSTNPAALSASQHQLTYHGAPIWRWVRGAQGQLSLLDVVNNRTIAAVTGSAAANTSQFFVSGVVSGGLSNTAGRPNATFFNQGGQWWDSDLGAPLWTNGSVWRVGVLRPTSVTANPDTSGATLAQLETEVNELKALLRTMGVIAP